MTLKTDMERYTINDLPDTSTEPIDDLRLSLSQNRLEFLWCAIKSHIPHRKIALAAVFIGIIVMLILGHFWKALTLLATLIVVYGKFLWNSNRLYSNLRRGNSFPILTSEGPQYIMSIYDGERYIRIESASWQEVETISFHADFLVIEMKEESESGLFYMWTGNMETAKKTALAMWSKALKAKAGNAVQPEYYSEAELAEVSDFIENTFGKYSYVLHEIVSPDIHIDIALIPPDENRNYCTLCTLGVGAHRMNIPDQYRYGHLLAEHAELLIYLPADWDLSEDGMNDERNYWPIRLLKDFARMPIETESWMAWGHSLSTEGNETFADGVPYGASILLSPQPDIYERCSLPLTTGKSVDFFQVFPLTREELEYKLSCANDKEREDSPTDALLDHFQMDRDNWTGYAMSRLCGCLAKTK